MRLNELRISGYRSLRQVRLPMKRINVITGPNGSGKSNLYRGLVLLARIADGGFSRAITEEGGMPSVLWAGPHKKGVIRMRLGVTLDDWHYDFACGPVAPSNAISFFQLDPGAKEEQVRLRLRGRPSVFLDRKGSHLALRNGDGKMVAYPGDIHHNEAALAEVRDPHLFPELHALRESMLSWRFYHRFRTDEQSPIRQAKVATQTPVLSADGHDLAAALVTLRELGRGDLLAEAIDTAFPGARLEIIGDAAHLTIGLTMPGLMRPLQANELSDGTLCYLCLIAALLSPRPPRLIALNEPETSLHPDLLEPLAKLIAHANRETQIWVTTHAEPLAAGIARFADVEPVRLKLEDGETLVEGQSLLDR